MHLRELLTSHTKGTFSGLTLFFATLTAVLTYRVGLDNLVWLSQIIPQYGFPALLTATCGITAVALRGKKAKQTGNAIWLAAAFFAIPYVFDSTALLSKTWAIITITLVILLLNTLITQIHVVKK